MNFHNPEIPDRLHPGISGSENCPGSRHSGSRDAGIAIPIYNAMSSENLLCVICQRFAEKELRGYSSVYV